MRPQPTQAESLSLTQISGHSPHRHQAVPRRSSLRRARVCATLWTFADRARSPSPAAVSAALCSAAGRRHLRAGRAAWRQNQDRQERAAARGRKVPRRASPGRLPRGWPLPETDLLLFSSALSGPGAYAAIRPSFAPAVLLPCDGASAQQRPVAARALHICGIARSYACWAGGGAMAESVAATEGGLVR